MFHLTYLIAVVHCPFTPCFLSVLMGRIRKQQHGYKIRHTRIILAFFQKIPNKFCRIMYDCHRASYLCTGKCFFDSSVQKFIGMIKLIIIILIALHVMSQIIREFKDPCFHLLFPVSLHDMPEKIGYHLFPCFSCGKFYTLFFIIYVHIFIFHSRTWTYSKV